MTQEEFDILATGIKSPSELWSKAFNEYNEHNSPRLSMGCYPCFFKVLDWLRKKYDLQHKTDHETGPRYVLNGRKIPIKTILKRWR